MTVKIDPAVEFYDPAADGYDLDKDPRCLYGWGPPEGGCTHWFGHACFRELGHPGLCDDSTEFDPDPCMKRRRPKNWDTVDRARFNR